MQASMETTSSEARDMFFARAVKLLLLSLGVISIAGCESNCALGGIFADSSTFCWYPYAFDAELRNADTGKGQSIWISTAATWVSVPADTGGVSHEIFFPHSRKIHVEERDPETGALGRYDSQHIYTFIAHREGANLYLVKCQEPAVHRGHDAEVVWDGSTLQCTKGWDAVSGHGY